MIIKPNEINILKNKENIIRPRYEKIEKKFNEEISYQTKYPYQFTIADDFGNELDNDVHKMFLENLINAGWFVSYKRMYIESCLGDYIGYKYIISDSPLIENKKWSFFQFLKNIFNKK